MRSKKTLRLIIRAKRKIKPFLFAIISLTLFAIFQNCGAKHVAKIDEDYDIVAQTVNLNAESSAALESSSDVLGLNQNSFCFTKVGASATFHLTNHSRGLTASELSLALSDNAKSLFSIINDNCSGSMLSPVVGVCNFTLVLNSFENIANADLNIGYLVNNQLETGPSVSLSVANMQKCIDDEKK